MVSLSVVHASNSLISSTFPAGLVALFVGATSGIGEITLKKFAAFSHQPRAYFIGRSQDSADRIVAELKTLNPAGEYIFINADVSLIRVVDDVCKDISAKEKSLNLLFLSAGVPDMDRGETSEHLHLLASLNYYSRIRFSTNLLPLLQKSSSLRRVVTVGGAGYEGPVDLTDFSALRVPVQELRGHLTTLVTLGFESVAKSAPEVSFIHDYPGMVDTPLTRAHLSGMPPEALKAFQPVPIDECGERHLYLATSQSYPPLESNRDGVPLGDGVGVAIGTTGETGSGTYSVGWDGESSSAEVRAFLAGLREKGVKEKIWKHTEEEFRRITQLGKEL